MSKNQKNLPQPLPAPITIVKKERSNPGDYKIANLVTLDPPFRGYSEVRFEHVILGKAQKLPRKERYVGGFTGVVKKVFSLQGELIGVVKILVKEKHILNEIKYQVVFNREIAYGTRNGKWYLFMHAYKVCLTDYLRDLQKFLYYRIPMQWPFFSIWQRLQMFVDYLTQIKKIHDRGEIVGDPKVDNVMIDWQQEAGQISNPTFMMIDFDAIHNKEDKSPQFAFTRCFLPQHLIRASKPFIWQNYSQHTDICIIADMLAQLFPEYFKFYVSNDDKVEPIVQQHRSRMQDSTANNIATIMALMKSSVGFDITQCVISLTRLIEYLNPDVQKIFKDSQFLSGQELEIYYNKDQFQLILALPGLEKESRAKWVRAALRKIAKTPNSDLVKLLNGNLIKADEIIHELITAIRENDLPFVINIANPALTHYPAALFEVAEFAAARYYPLALMRLPIQTLRELAESKTAVPRAKENLIAAVLNELSDSEDLSNQAIINRMTPAQCGQYGKILQAAGYKLPSFPVAISNRYRLLATIPAPEFSLDMNGPLLLLP